MSDPLTDLAELEGVPSALAAARDAVDSVLADRGRRAVSAEQSAHALWDGARASAELEAVVTGDGQDWSAGSVRMASELVPLAALLRVSPGQVLARLHTLAARDVLGEAAGRPRDEAEVGARMVGITRLLTATTRAPALVLAAVVHGEVASVAPFGRGDGLVARAVEHQILIGAGIDPNAVLVPAAGHRAAGGRYAALLQGYAGGSVAGVRNWILHCAQAVTRGAEMSPATQ